MPFHRTLSAPLLAAMLAIAGCSSPAQEVVVPPAARPVVAVTEYPAAAGILSGFEIAPTREDWNIGDQALVAIRATKKDGAIVTRYLLIELTGELEKEPMVFKTRDAKRGPFRFESPVGHTMLTLFDEQGAKIEQATGKFAAKFLGYGVFDGVEMYTEFAEPVPDPKNLPPMTDEQFERSMRGWLTLMAFSGSMNKQGMFKQMLRDVIARPNLLKLIFNPSVGLNFPKGQWPSRDQRWRPGQPETRAATLAEAVEGLGEPSTPTFLDAINLPLQLSIADTPAMIGSIRCVEPLAPLSLCGGLMHAKGWNPENPSIALEITLLACKRGTGGRELREVEK